jgi:hypothetical protein
MGTEDITSNTSNTGIDFYIKPDTDNTDTNSNGTSQNTKRKRGPYKKRNKEFFVEDSEFLLKTPSNPTLKLNKNDKALIDICQTLLNTTFGVMENFNPVWKVSEDETKSIAEPLSRIIARLIPSETSSKYGDFVLLIGALSLTLGSRIMIMRGEKKNETKATTNSDRTIRPFERKSAEIGNDTRVAASNTSHIINTLPNILE